MSSEVSAPLSSCCLCVEGRSLGEMRCQYAISTSGWDFDKVMITNFWSHGDEGLDTDGKGMRNLSEVTFKTITDLLTGEEEKKLHSLIFLETHSLILRVGLYAQWNT